jgi:dienelactone hydrolase
MVNLNPSHSRIYARSAAFPWKEQSMSGKSLLVFGATLAVLAFVAQGADEHGAADPRLSNVRTLYQGSGFDPAVYSSKEQWLERARFLREQVLVAAGLWPLPEKCELNATVHSPIDRGDYTVEKVFFQSYPGFYVTGNLYRPKGKTGPFPAVLCPHGHWADGRFYRNPDQNVERELSVGTDKDADAARYPLQARCANLAKMGCVVFHYDMVGYADADPQRFPHRATYRDIDSDLRTISMFGLQMWDSMRALDFVLSLPDVDKSRIACTGASGGGTQTFFLMATDNRLTVGGPVCMISAGDHQGGCVCENASLLRVFTDNVEVAAAFAPRPFVHPTATGDWTKEFMEKGYPEIQAIYRLFGAEQNVFAARFTSDHNYNLNSRQTVYNFFNKHLKLGQAEPVTEQKFQPLPREQLSVFDARHPRPANSVDAAALKTYLIESARKQMEAIRPKDKDSLERFRQIIGAALRHMVNTDLPAKDAVVVHRLSAATQGGYKVEKLLLSRKGAAEQLPAVLYTPDKANGSATVVVAPEGKASLLSADGAPAELLAGLLTSGQAVLAVDVFMTGELSSSTNPATMPNIEFFAGYNRTVLANRVHDILTAVAAAQSRQGIASVNLIGTGKAGPWCLLARALAGNAVARTAADADRFEFTSIKSQADENYLPASLRYGGMYALASLAAPAELFVYNAPRAGRPESMMDAYTAARALDKLRVEPASSAATVIQWITR